SSLPLCQFPEAHSNFASCSIVSTRRDQLNLPCSIVWVKCLLTLYCPKTLPTFKAIAVAVNGFCLRRSTSFTIRLSAFSVACNNSSRLRFRLCQQRVEANH